MRVIEREEVARRLTYEVCIPIVRRAMIAFSKGETRQLLRSIIPLHNGRMLGIMPGALGEHEPFGAKLISVYPEISRKANSLIRASWISSSLIPESRFASFMQATLRRSAPLQQAPLQPTPSREPIRIVLLF